MNNEFIKDACARLETKPSVMDYIAKEYQESFLPIIRQKYLSHLVSTLEDLITEKQKKSEAPCRYKIILKAMVLARPATTRFFPNGALIVYDNRLVGKQAQILIAHELGHIANKQLFEIENNEQNANAFAFIVVNDKNEFYLSDCKDYTFKGKETEIINEIKNICK